MTITVKKIRNLREHIKAYETILNASKRSIIFLEVLTGKADKSSTCDNSEQLLGTDIRWNEAFWKTEKEERPKN